MGRALAPRTPPPPLPRLLPIAPRTPREGRAAPCGSCGPRGTPPQCPPRSPQFAPAGRGSAGRRARPGAEYLPRCCCRGRPPARPRLFFGAIRTPFPRLPGERCGHACMVCTSGWSGQGTCLRNCILRPGIIILRENVMQEVYNMREFLILEIRFSCMTYNA